MDRNQWIKQYGGMLLVLLSAIVFYKAFDNFGFIGEVFNLFMRILTPIIIGTIIAYALSPFAIKVENFLEQAPKPFREKKRAYSVLFVVLVVLVIFVMIVTVVSPIIAGALVNVVYSLNSYISHFEQNITNTFSDPTIQAFIFMQQENLVSFLTNLEIINPLAYVSSVFSAASTVSTFVLGFVFCPYILIERDRLMHLIEEVLLLLLSKKHVNVLKHYVRRSHYILGNFVYGKFIDSLIIGIIAALGLWMLGVDAFIFLAIILFITNMIPYFGPFIGGVPVVFVTFIAHDVSTAIWVALFILALQQFDGLILGPAILGESVGISPFWVIFSITVFGGLWGFVGMFLGVPIICIIREIFNDFITYRNNIKG